MKSYTILQRYRTAIVCLFIFLFCVVPSRGQTLVDVYESTFKVGGFGEEVFYYGFCEGDQLVFNFEEKNNKELKELEIMELPGSSKFMDFKTKVVANKVLNIPKNGIYRFRFANTAMGGRVCKVKIQRIPLNESSRAFNSSVYWREVQDTTFNPVQERFLVSSDTSVTEIYSAIPKVSSGNALNGNRPYQVVDFILPVNTVSWSFYIACGDRGRSEYEKAEANFARSAANAISSIPGYGPLGALAITGLSYFNAVQGEDNVRYSFLTDGNSAVAFLAAQPYLQYKSGDVISEASQMKYPLKGKVYLGLFNDNAIKAIAVTLKVGAVTVNQQWDTRIVQKMEIRTRQEAYLQN